MPGLSQHNAARKKINRKEFEKEPEKNIKAQGTG
jgi:hypothetical protein